MKYRNRFLIWCVVAAIWFVEVGQGLAAVWPGKDWEAASPESQGMAPAKLEAAVDYAVKNGGGSGCVIRHGLLVKEWGNQKTLYDLKSSSKAIGVTVLGLALKDGKVQLDDPASKYHTTLGTPPATNAATGWIDRITLRHLANQCAGFDKPGGYNGLLFAPGTKWSYSDAGPNWLAECLTFVYQRDLNEVMFERVFTPLGIAPDDIRWRENAFRPHEMNGIKRREFGSGFSANVRAMARIGYLYLRQGKWRDEQILPADFVRAAGHPAPELRGLEESGTEHGNASEHYSLLWWNNGDGTIPGLPRDAFWSWGLYDSLILVVPSLDIVVARAGKGWPRTSDEHYDPLKPFFEPIAASVAESGHDAKPRAAVPPYPPSPVIAAIQWASTNEIIRLAKGSDTWPATWAGDDRLYTAYGDGMGFEPFVPRKLSMGLATVTGQPPGLTGTNLRSAGAEFVGDGQSGRKASGMLMVGGTLYLLVRNAGNAQLGWSRDKGQTWEWAGWKFTNSFGAPTFLNFGRNYAGARDGFVYIYSHDNGSAYQPADRMVMARVSRERLTEQGTYEFFAGLDQTGEPRWDRDISQRAAVFENPGNCYRSGITYDAAIKRYLWCQILPHSTHLQGTRFQGGFGIYDAPEPWGPWTTVFFTGEWDVGPGETSSLPTKWMSADGTSLYLLFSGNDFFSVRQASLKISMRPE